MPDLTRLLADVEARVPDAGRRLLPLVYRELRRLATALMAREQPGHTLTATALVHEAYLRLVPTPETGWANRRHFYATAATAMRRILVESARRKRRHKHGGGRRRVGLEDLSIAVAAPSLDALALDEAVERFAAEDPLAAELFQLHVFTGLPVEEAGELLGRSRATAYRHWTYARAWFRAELKDE